LIRRGAAHECHNFAGGHPEVAVPAQTFDQFLAAGSSARVPGDFHQADNAGLYFELDIRPRHKPGALPYILGDGYLAFGGDPHGKHL
jgi:hypothetical protein